MTTDSQMTDEMTCRELVEVITAYLEGALPEADRIKFDRHLADCPDCRVYLDQMRQTILVLHGLAAEKMMSEDQQTLLALFRDWKGS